MSIIEQKTVAVVSGVVFILVALLHLLRLIFGWSAVFNGWSVPMWVSILGLIVAGALVWMNFSAAK